MPSHIISISSHVMINVFDSFFSDGMSSSAMRRAHIFTMLAQTSPIDSPLIFQRKMENKRNIKELYSKLVLKLWFDHKHKSNQSKPCNYLRENFLQ